MDHTPLKLASAPAGGLDGHLSTAKCDVLSRAWHVAGLLEELRNDLKSHVRQSASRDMAQGALETALNHLIIGAQILVPGLVSEQVDGLKQELAHDRLTRQAAGNGS